MSNQAAFVIPNGVSFEQHPEGISIEFDQDVIIQTSLGLPIKKISSRFGNVRIDVPATIHEISAPQGGVFLKKETTVSVCSAKSLETQEAFTAESIHLSGSMQCFSSLSCSDVHVEGSINVTGKSALKNVDITGSARFAQDLSFEHGSFGADLTVQGACSAKKITAQGNIRLHGHVQAEHLISDESKISCEQSVQLKLLRGKNITLKGKTNDITAIQAHEMVSISEGSLNSDVLVAQKADIHPNTIGKIMIVDVESALGPHSIKGCLSPEDIAPLLPNPQLFMKQRGILVKDDQSSVIEEEPQEKMEAEETLITDTVTIEESNVPESAPGHAEEPPKEEPIPFTEIASEEQTLSQVDIFKKVAQSHHPSKSFEEELSDIIHTPEVHIEDPSSESEADSFDEMETLQEPPKPEEKTKPYTEEDIIPLSEFYTLKDTEKPGIEVAEQVPPPLVVIATNPTDDEDSSSEEDDLPMHATFPEAAKTDLYEQFRKQVNIIIEDYEGDMPTSLHQLLDLIEAQEYGVLRVEIKPIWSQILRFHQKRNTRIPAKVTMAFNEINKLLN